jgi:nicotinamidase/pyrazinamidase
MPDARERLQKGDGLLLVDVQNDFCPGGALPVPEGDRVVPVLNRWLAASREFGCPVYASRDWHPARHLSFREQGGDWPPHCLQDSEGARFHPDLQLPDDVVKVTKGVRFDQDQYSVLDQTGLATQLQRDGVRRLWVGGLALDVCVRASVLDALSAGLSVMLLADATRAVSADKAAQVLAELQGAGAEIVRESQGAGR